MTDMYSLFVAFVLGVVEGLTEFLPVSSTGHMIIVGELLGFTGDKAKTFEVIIQLGSILAVVVVFWRRLFGLIGIHFGKVPHEGKTNGHLTLGHILLAMIPAVGLGLAFHDVIKSLFNPQSVMYALVAGGLLLLAAEWFNLKILRLPGWMILPIGRLLPLVVSSVWRYGRVFPARVPPFQVGCWSV